MKQKIKQNIKEKYWGILLFYILFSCFGFSQQKNKADSLLVLSKGFVKKSKLDKALEMAEESLIIYNNIGDKRLIGDNLNLIAIIHYYKNDFKSALHYYDEGVKSFEEANYTTGVATLLNNIGGIYYYKGNYPRAIENYKKALRYHEQSKNIVKAAFTTQNIGSIYLELNDLENAMKHFKDAKKAYQDKNHLESLPQVLASIGNVYLEKGNNKKAYENLQSSLKLTKKQEDKQQEVETLFSLGKYYEMIDDFDTSYKYYKKVLKLSTGLKSNLYASSSLIASGKLDLKFNKIKRAIIKCRRGYAISKSINVISVEQDACKCLYEAYKKSNKKSTAFFYLEKMYQLKDSLNLKQTTNKILSMKYEKEILLDSIADVEKERKVKILHQKEVANKEKQRNIFMVAVCFAVLVALGILSRLNYVRKSKKRLQIEKDRSENLLLNILPEEIAEELKDKGFVDAQDFDTVAVLFTDFKSFTETSEKMTPKELVEEINICFKAFDTIIEKHDIEKIKTIGDAYMAVGGLPVANDRYVKRTVLAAIEMQNFITKRKDTNDILKKPAFEMRVGIHVGHLVAGIVGIKKFQYDVWGDTVNTASRIESNGEVGKVNISQSVYEILKEDNALAFTNRGSIKVKGKGELAMYFVDKK